LWSEAWRRRCVRREARVRGGLYAGATCRSTAGSAARARERARQGGDEEEGGSTGRLRRRVLRLSGVYLMEGETQMKQPHPFGIGLGLRWEFLDEVLTAQSGDLAPVSFFEISPENYMRRGGFYPAALERVAERHAVTTHGLSMSLGSTDALDDAYLTELAAFLTRFGGDWHSDHLSFSGVGGAFLHDLLPVPFTSRSAQRVAARVRQASERIERRMAVENVSYYASLGGAPLDEASFVTEVLETANCGLLLDLNNLDVNAHNHGFDAREWLARVPLERVVEIHVAGPETWKDGLLLDTHGSEVRPSVYELLSYVIERVGPKPVLLERDNNVPSLTDLLAEVRALDATYRAALERHFGEEAAHAA
jgi:uncharacterized protein (UPF0276 family)